MGNLTIAEVTTIKPKEEVMAAVSIDNELGAVIFEMSDISFSAENVYLVIKIDDFTIVSPELIISVTFNPVTLSFDTDGFSIDPIMIALF